MLLILVFSKQGILLLLDWLLGLWLKHCPKLLLILLLLHLELLILGFLRLKHAKLFLLKLVFLTKYLLLQGSLYLIVGELPFICKILKGTHLMLSKLLLRLPKLVPLLMTSVL